MTRLADATQGHVRGGARSLPCYCRVLLSACIAVGLVLIGGTGCTGNLWRGPGGESCASGCLRPPPPDCADAQTLRVYGGPGACDNLVCRYPSATRACAQGCQSGRCNGEPLCGSIICNDPPPASCVAADILRVHQSPGTCANGACSYPPLDTPCPQGCTGNICRGGPDCGGSQCLAPPAPTCVSGSTLRTFTSPGTCVGGECNYPLQDLPCPTGCQGNACVTSGTVLHVDASAGSGGNGAIGSPFGSIQAAVNGATSGTTILIAAGTYPQNVTVQNKTVHLLGGYKGGGDYTTRNPTTHATHIQGSSGSSTVELTASASSTLDGFRITGGSGKSMSPGRRGGGVYVESGAPTISNNVIESNGSQSSEENRGGGIYAKDANVKIVDNVIRNNQSGRGAGIAIDGGTITISGNKILDNRGGSDHGGGIYCSAQATIRNNHVAGNEIGKSLGYGWGGGIYLFEGSNATLQGNVVTNNYAPTTGAGVFVDNGGKASLSNELIYNNRCTEQGGVGLYVDGLNGVGSVVTVNHSTIADNSCPSAANGGNGVFVEQHSTVTVTNSIFWGNGDDFYKDGTSSLAVHYTSSSESWAGSGNMSGNPLFVNPAAGDYHLRSTRGHWNGASFTNDSQTSPCIDKADPSAPHSQESSPNGGRANLGAYGNTPHASKSP